ncbi:hypothetical protein AAAV92_10820 [Selenomonas noxia]|jgi:hypothetical protein|uniref:hypothetical protein n=1 Tax=Selenomonas noxia TaxID=135083 RepID=UPI00205689DF|nr:MAG TPA: Protein of unknown function (DUF2717) [Caudoviricetes sp.]
MKDNMERDIPYVSKELCEYLRERFSLQNIVHDIEGEKRAERILGSIAGVNSIIETLEEIQIRQEENDGLRG